MPICKASQVSTDPYLINLYDEYSYIKPRERKKGGSLYLGKYSCRCFTQRKIF